MISVLLILQNEVDIPTLIINFINEEIPYLSNMRTIWKSHQRDLSQKISSKIALLIFMDRWINEFYLTANLMMKPDHHYEFDGF